MGRHAICLALTVATFVYCLVSVARCRSDADAVQMGLQQMREVRAEIRAMLIESGLLDPTTPDGR